MPRRCSAELERQVVDFYNQGLNTVEIAQRTGLANNTSVRRVLLRNNVDLISTGERLTRVKDNPFSNLQDPKVQYWLGYITADGCISERDGVPKRIRLCTNKDPEHLELYVKFLNNKVKINKSYNKRYDVWEYSVGFTNLEAASFLVELGITPRKSLTLELNFDFDWNFMRGYLDGNGYVRKKEIAITTGSHKFAEQACRFMNSQSVISYIATHNPERPNTHTIRVSCEKDNLNRFVHYLYGQNDSPALARKKSILLAQAPLISNN